MSSVTAHNLWVELLLRSWRKNRPSRHAHVDLRRAKRRLHRRRLHRRTAMPSSSLPAPPRPNRHTKCSRCGRCSTTATCCASASPDQGIRRSTRPRSVGCAGAESCSLEDFQTHGHRAATSSASQASLPSERLARITAVTDMLSTAARKSRRLRNKDHEMGVTCHCDVCAHIHRACPLDCVMAAEVCIQNHEEMSDRVLSDAATHCAGIVQSHDAPESMRPKSRFHCPGRLVQPSEFRLRITGDNV